MKNFLYLCSTMDIKFKEVEAYRSQRTVAKILRGYKYHFVPVNEYDNNYFICMLLCPIGEPVKDLLRKYFKFLKFKPNEKTKEIPLCLDVYGMNDAPVIEPIVFDRTEIQNIVGDVPDNYVGEKTL